MRTSKISFLPHAIREQLNRRLHDNQRPATILQWLNALPETKALLAADFDGNPITKQNLSDWRFGGFRDWLLKFEAHEFFAALTIEETNPTNSEIPTEASPQESTASGDPNSTATPPVTDHALAAPKSDVGGSRITNHASRITHQHLNKLLQWTILQYAATATVITNDDDPRSRWTRVREFCADISRLRRSDLYSQYIDIQRDYLVLEQSNSIAEKEKQFHAWAKREDIIAKLKAEGKKRRGLSNETLKEILDKLNLM